MTEPRAIAEFNADMLVAPADVIAIVRDFGSLCDGLRRRVQHLGITFNTLDEAGFMANGHSSKILAPRPTKMIGKTTLPALLASTGCMLLLVEDQHAMAQIEPLLQKSTRKQFYAGNAMLARRKAQRRKSAPFRANPAFAKMMRSIQILKQSPAQRKTIARKAARARWSKKKKAK